MFVVVELCMCKNIFLHVCSYRCAWVCVNLCVCMWVRNMENNSGCRFSSGTIHHVFSLSLPLSVLGLPIWLDWLATKPQGLPVPIFPLLRLEEHASTSGVLHGFWSLNSGSRVCNGKHCANWALSPVLDLLTLWCWLVKDFSLPIFKGKGRGHWGAEVHRCTASKFQKNVFFFQEKLETQVVKGWREKGIGRSCQTDEKFEITVINSEIYVKVGWL